MAKAEYTPPQMMRRYDKVAYQHSRVCYLQMTLQVQTLATEYHSMKFSLLAIASRARIQLLKD